MPVNHLPLLEYAEGAVEERTSAHQRYGVVVDHLHDAPIHADLHDLVPLLLRRVHLRLGDHLRVLSFWEELLVGEFQLVSDLLRAQAEDLRDRSPSRRECWQDLLQSEGLRHLQHLARVGHLLPLQLLEPVPGRGPR